jgi:hypothetical protein
VEAGGTRPFTIPGHKQRTDLVGDPSYVGTLSDVQALARVAHAAGVPLLVDAAWARTGPP